MGVEFSDRGYRQLVMALREARPTENPTPPAAPEYVALAIDGETAFLDPQGHIRWVKDTRVGEVPAPWRLILVGEPRS